ncbi:MAG: DNA repair protein RadC [Ruminococcaceae bacterium]|nr:DNA repair protein RadC [Oscillospiraceae bacterium]
MENLSRKGHRQRVKESYLKNSFDAMPDHNILELILFYAIPQKDVKPIAYNLINHFGSLENVLNADVSELIQVDGIQEHSAILLTLFRDVHRRLNQQKADVQYRTFEQLMDFASMKLKDYQTETVLIVTFDNAKSIINTHILTGGEVNSAVLNKKDVAQFVIRDNASSVVVAHNHPSGSAVPSAADIDATISLSQFLRQINIALLDHIVVGGDGTVQSIKGDLRYAKYFDN